VGEEVTRESMATLREDLADLRERLRDAQRTAADLPHRSKYLLLVTDFMNRLFDLHLELVDEVDERLDGDGRAQR
jgi:hypothetical protein